MNNEFNISKIFVSNTAPTNVAKGKLWLDTSVSPSQLKESNGTTWINCGSTITIDNITLPVESVIESIGLELEGKADKSALNNYLPLTGGTITKNSQWDAQPIILVEDTYNGFGYTMDSGITVKGSQEHKYDTIISTTSILPNRIIGDAVTDSITPESNKLLTSGGAYTALQSKANDSEVVKKVNNIAPTSGNVTIKSNDIALTSNITVNGFTTTTVQNCLGKLNSEKVNTPVVGDLSSLTTTDKTSIVSAVNELNSKLLANTPAPITNVHTISNLNLASFITDTTYANIQGKILISPNINNLGAIYVGQSITDKSKAFPLYPNQIVSFSFTDITTFNVTGDILGDKFNYVIEFGLLNASTTPANGLVVLGTNGLQYRLDPTGDAGSETFTLTKIS